MAENRAETILRRADELASDRANFEDLWQQIAERMLPGSAHFTVKRTAGEARTEKMLDATAALALRKYATILESMATPRNQRYHRLTAAEDVLNKIPAVTQYLEDLNRRLFKARYAPSANFAGQIGQMFLEGGGFGTAAMFVDEVPGYGLRYRALPLSETYLVENHVGLVDTFYRRFEYTARQAFQRWGNALPPEIVQAAERRPGATFCFVHCVEPSAGRTGPGLTRDHRYSSEYVSETGKAIVQTGGYYTFPLPLMRELTVPGEVYGRSPGTWVLPDVKMLNEMTRSVIRAAQKVVDPPLLMTEDGSLQSFDLRPGAANPGTLGPNGEELVKPFNNQARVDIGFELLQQKQQQINEAYFINLFQILVENPRMTATEVLERAQEKGMLLGPLAGRLQSEFLGPMIEREIDLLARAGQLPPPPDELVEAGAEYKIEYESPLARAQRAEEGVAIVRTFESMAPLLEQHPEILDNFDLDETVRTMAEINGMAAKLMRDPKDVAAIREDRSQQQEAMATAELAPGMAKAARDVSAMARGVA